MRSDVVRGCGLSQLRTFRPHRKALKALRAAGQDPLTVEVKLSPQDIDQVRVGQMASLRFSSFNQRTTPELDGRVSFVSADITQDQKTGNSFYTGRISVSDSELMRLGEVKLIAGMPVEAFVKTSERNMISYLTKPMADQIARAFRETALGTFSGIDLFRKKGP